MSPYVDHTAAESAELFVNSLPDQPSSRQVRQLSTMFGQFAQAGYKVALSQALEAYDLAHPERCEPLDAEACGCFRCQLSSFLGRLPELEPPDFPP